MRYATLYILAALICSCASEPLTDYERQDREVRRLEEYYRFKHECQASGGVVVIRRHSSPRIRSGDDAPRKFESYGCAGAHAF